VKDSFHEELESVFDKLPKYHMKILLGDFSAKVGREDIFKPTTGNESPHEISNDNGVRSVSFATFKNLGVKSTMSPNHNIHKHTWTSPDGKSHNQINHILVDRRRHSNVLDARSFRAADCEINELTMNNKNKNIRDLFRAINEFERCYQLRNNLVKDENGDLLADSHNIFNFLSRMV
jgi:hypothetical protein